MRCWQTTSARPPRATASNSARSGPTAANYSPPQNSSAQSTTEECQRRSGPVVSELAQAVTGLDPAQAETEALASARQDSRRSSRREDSHPFHQRDSLGL